MGTFGSHGAVLAKELASLSREDVFSALEREDEEVVSTVSRCITWLAEEVGAGLKEGRDYLPLLTPNAETPAVLAVAMEIVLETLEEELDQEDAD